MKKILIQAFKFFGFSGIGWLIDMTIFIILTSLSVSEVIANLFSSFVAVTFVYFASTKKLFTNSNKKFNLKQKYIVYFVYQFFMISISSIVIGALSNLITNITTIAFLLSYKKIISKIIVTPFTMVINFIFMRFLIEKV